MSAILQSPRVCLKCSLKQLFSSTSRTMHKDASRNLYVSSAREKAINSRDSVYTRQSNDRPYKSERSWSPPFEKGTKSQDSLDQGPRSPKSQPSWSHLPDWRRQNLSIRHKLSVQANKPDEEVAGIVPGSSHWSPRKKLSPDAMAGIRTLHKTNPEYDVPRLADLFKVSPDAIRRILKSRWVPTPQEAKDRDERWKKRKMEIAKARIAGHS